jgi:hypothetical protein
MTSIVLTDANIAHVRDDDAMRDVLAQAWADIPQHGALKIRLTIAPDHDEGKHYVLALYRLWQPSRFYLPTRPLLLAQAQAMGVTLQHAEIMRQQVRLRDVLAHNSITYYQAQALLRHAPSTPHFWLQPDDDCETFWQHIFHLTLIR